MNRYTKRGANGRVYGTGPATVCWGGRPVGERAFCVGCHGTKDNRGVDRSKCGPLAIIDRLAAYEDTWLSPEEYKKCADALKKLDIEHMHDLLQAEMDGRLVVLPCKVGDTVYVTYGEGYKACVVDRMYIMADNQVQVRMRHNCNETLWLSAAFGKTVFLTREEAEAALKKREEADNEAD